jgi:hypothetical protein|tara:strand:- start:555 stop:800 length:246 start_codon:yes stop_codon:yes gene_type:complete
MSKQTYNVGKMKLFINKRKPVVQPIIIKKEASIEEQRKELLYWESQYEKLFDIIEKKRQYRLNKALMYSNMFSINLKNKQN